MARPKAENAAEQEKLLSKDERAAVDVWDAQPACPSCGGRPGYNPLSGITIRDGHRASCQKNLAKK